MNVNNYTRFRASTRTGAPFQYPCSRSIRRCSRVMSAKMSWIAASRSISLRRIEGMASRSWRRGNRHIEPVPVEHGGERRIAALAADLVINGDQRAGEPRRDGGAGQIGIGANRPRIGSSNAASSNTTRSRWRRWPERQRLGDAVEHPAVITRDMDHGRDGIGRAHLHEEPLEDGAPAAVPPARHLLEMGLRDLEGRAAATAAHMMFDNRRGCVRRRDCVCETPRRIADRGRLRCNRDCR